MRFFLSPTPIILLHCSARGNRLSPTMDHKRWVWGQKLKTTQTESLARLWIWCQSLMFQNVDATQLWTFHYTNKLCSSELKPFKAGTCVDVFFIIHLLLLLFWHQLSCPNKGTVLQWYYKDTEDPSILNLRMTQVMQHKKTSCGPGYILPQGVASSCWANHWTHRCSLSFAVLWTAPLPTP